jgi:ADP-ribosyl-[dinitrogen reductase] hydrolase
MFRHRYVLYFSRSSIPNQLDIGITTREVLEIYEQDMYERPGQPFKLSGPTHESTSGNGSLMRLAPIPTFFYHNPPLAIQHAALQSRITHGSSLAVESCQLACAQIIGFITQPEDASPRDKKQRVLSSRFVPSGLTNLTFTTEKVNELWEGTWKEKTTEQIKTTGFVIASHEAALWALWNTETFEEVRSYLPILSPSYLMVSINEGMLKLLPMGADVDTVCAIYGQIAGACYGIESIPTMWLNDVKPREMLDNVFGTLVKGALERSAILLNGPE